MVTARNPTMNSRLIPILTLKSRISDIRSLSKTILAQDLAMLNWRESKLRRRPPTRKERLNLL